MNTNTALRPSLRLVTTVRDELRDRRLARASRRTLERELASYDTPAQVSDLLGSLTGDDDARVQEIRDIVLRNELRHGLHRAS
ncbi:MAG: hypothetical protein JF565_02610 [Propionibacteriales bacterium]|jgi:hypothetical protein|nr:hypothetical protein [Propionibacteriales bacterium]